MLKQQIQNDSISALKNGDKDLTMVLRSVISVINLKEKEKRYKVLEEKKDLEESQLIKESELTDDEIISVFSSEIKKRKDASALYEKGNRPELLEKEKKEIEILKKYLPEQLGEEELKKIIEESIVKVGAKEVKDTGKIMADLMPKIKGKADNSEVSKIIKELLTR